MTIKTARTSSGWMSAVRWTVFGTLGCAAISLAFNYALFRGFPSDVFRLVMMSAALLPVLVAAPLFFFLGLKLRERAAFSHKLNEMASIDSLTSCLNRTSFSSLADAFLASNGVAPAPRHGALLVVDADHLKAINDRFGLDWGDEALRVIGGVIRASVRSGDLVGRLGGEEFGVFLPGASDESAHDVAERIRLAVSQAMFEPGGTKFTLTVSVGGAVFEDQIEFNELFRAADLRLREAKTGGRNRIEITHIPAGRTDPQNQVFALARLPRIHGRTSRPAYPPPCGP